MTVIGPLVPRADVLPDVLEDVTTQSRDHDALDDARAQALDRQLWQLAHTTLRELRRRKFAVRVEGTGATALLYVRPKAQLTTYQRQAIERCKPQILAILAQETAQGHVHCGVCGAVDWMLRRDGTVFCAPCHSGEESTR